MGMQNVLANLTQNAGIKLIYGDPIGAGDITVVPVAKVVYGFGGGEGTGRPAGEQRPAGEGSGAGGGFAGIPTGYIEITPQQSRFVPIGDKRRIAVALALGVLIGLMLGRRR